MLLLFALPLRAEAKSKCWTDERFEAETAKIAEKNQARLRRALEKKKIEKVERVPFHLSERDQSRRPGTIREHRGVRLVLVRGEVLEGHHPYPPPMTLALSPDRTLSPLVIEHRRGRVRTVERCGVKSCEPSKAAPEVVEKKLVVLALEDGETWSNRTRRVRVRHDALHGRYAKEEPCPNVP